MEPHLFIHEQEHSILLIYMDLCSDMIPTIGSWDEQTKEQEFSFEDGTIWLILLTCSPILSQMDDI